MYAVGMLQYEDLLFEESTPSRPAIDVEFPQQTLDDVNRLNHLPEDPDDYPPPSPSSDKEKPRRETESITWAQAEQAGLAFQLRENTTGVAILACSPDGKWIAGSMNQNAVATWDASNGDPVMLHEPHELPITCLVFSSDSTRYASGAGFNAKVWMKDILEPLVTLEGHMEAINALAFHPLDSNQIAIAAGDNEINICSTTTGETLKTFGQHGALVTAVAFSNDGKRLLSGGVDECVIAWDIETGQHIRKMVGHENVIWSISDSHDGRRIVSSSDDGTSRIWSAESGDALAILGECSGPVWSVRFTPDDSRIQAISNNSTVIVYDSYTGDKVFDIASDPTSDQPTVAAFSPDGKWLAVRWGDSSIRILSAVNGEPVKMLEMPSDNLISLLFTPDSQGLVASGGDNQVLVWTVVT